VGRNCQIGTEKRRGRITVQGGGATPFEGETPPRTACDRIIGRVRGSTGRSSFAPGGEWLSWPGCRFAFLRK
jgi:hypothetical protein